MKIEKLKIGLGVAMVALVAACGTIDPAKVAKIDPTGKGEFLGMLANTFGEDDIKTVCRDYGHGYWCDATKYKTAAVILANGYTSGMAKAPTIIPIGAPAVSGSQRGNPLNGDIVRVKFNGQLFEYIETVATYGDESCKWDSFAYSGGVECPRLGYSYKKLKSYSNGVTNDLVR